MEAQPDVEILVHIGAPSRAVDDARYRSLAAAYLACGPMEAVPFHPQSQSGRDDNSKGSRHLPAIDDDDDDDESFHILSDDRNASFQSIQASFRSVVDNANSPRVPVHEIPSHSLHQEIPTSSPGSWETPPSIVQDSHPMHHANFTSLTSPTRVLENYLQHFESPSDSYKEGSQADRTTTPYKHDSQLHGHRVTARNPVACAQQLIPCTPQVRQITEQSFDKSDDTEYQNSSDPQEQPEAEVIDDTSDDNIIEETTFLSSSQPSVIGRADSEPPPQLRQLSHVTSPHALARAASDIGPRSVADHRAPVTIQFLGSHGFTYESLEIHAPEPPISDPHIEPEHLITPALRNLGRDVGLPSRFRPEEQTREPRPFERGYWLLDCSSWEPRLKRDAWAFLANYIGTGTAGWGVWCKRDPDFGELRVYCWGSVVAHIYYVLWLSSQRKIVFTGSSWMDAGGARVITMGPRDYQQR
ncbi:hypothetical protein F4802DRAFT_499421 [Xylaria palmicola]|nr:hypothetical protein F4802DRAFT_499421 [Xylaria palmicola]